MVSKIPVQTSIERDGKRMVVCSECADLLPRDDGDAQNQHMMDNHPEVVLARWIDHDQQPPGQVLR